MSAMASQITGFSIVYPTVCAGLDQRKHQRSTTLVFVRGIPQWSVNSQHKGPATRKMFHLMTSSWTTHSVVFTKYTAHTQIGALWSDWWLVLALIKNVHWRVGLWTVQLELLDTKRPLKSVGHKYRKHGHILFVLVKPLKNPIVCPSVRPPGFVVSVHFRTNCSGDWS